MIVYIEKKAKDYEVAKAIIKKFNPKTIEINHYKDIFNKSHQDYNYQKSQNRLILAVKENSFLYKGSFFVIIEGIKTFIILLKF